MKPSNLPTGREFLQENKNVYKSYVPWLIFWFSFTIVCWFVDIQVLNIQGLEGKVLGVFPRHYFPEWVSLFELGFFVAQIRKTLIPMSLIVVSTYFVGVVVGLIMLGFSNFSLLFNLVFMSPFSAAYLIQRLIHRKIKE